MTRDHVLNLINHVFGDIGGVIGNPHQITRRRQLSYENIDLFRLTANSVLDEVECLTVKFVDFAVPPADLARHRRIEINQRVEALPPVPVLAGM